MAGTLQRLYDSSPIAFQNLMVSIQGWRFAHRRWDRSLMKCLLSDLEESQWWSADQFEAYQNQRLHALVVFAGQHIPYYQELFQKEGIDPAQVRTKDDLKRIPILEKDVVRRHPDKFLMDGRPRREWRKSHTSGTTGTPLVLYSSRESFTRHWSFICRLRTWAGLADPLLPRRVQFTGRDIVPIGQGTEKKVYWRHNRPGNALLCSTAHLTPENVPYYIEAMRKFAPELIDGYPSAILLIARAAHGLGMDLPRPQAIITTAETLFPEWREEIESTYGCQVFDQYASSDASSFWSTCEHGIMHMNPEYGISEIVDAAGRDVSPGEEGDVVATAFIKREQVLIRYRIGDRAVPGPAQLCACGRAMPRVARVTGRIDDWLYIPGRGYVRAWNMALKHMANVTEIQIIHEAPDFLHVLVVPESGYGDETRKQLRQSLMRKVGSDIHIEIEEVAAIPRGPNGKFRPVISKCRETYPSEL